MPNDTGNKDTKKHLNIQMEGDENYMFWLFHDFFVFLQRNEKESGATGKSIMAGSQVLFQRPACQGG